MIIDAFEFARREQEASGSVAVKDLRRLEVIEGDEILAWRVAGSMDERSRPFIDLRVTGRVHLACQRCLRPVAIEVDVAGRFLVAQNEAEADAIPLDEDHFDVVVGTREFDLLKLVEDEIILWLPIVPKHEQCPQALTDEIGQGPGDRRSPFAVLGTLKKERKL
jgi:uncharacterized protein